MLDRARWPRVAATAVCLVALCDADPVAGDSGRTPPPLGAMIASAASRAGVPAELLAAVIWVESGRWPWALNVGGRPVYPRSRAEAAVWLRAVGGRADIGLAQVHYRYDQSIEDVKRKLRFDLLYVRRMCLMLDARILAWTLLVVITGRGIR